MRRLDPTDLRLLAEELPATLFIAYNGVMAWLAWSLSRDVELWRAHAAAGEFKHLPPHEPGASEAILAGLPAMWLLGAVLLGALAAYWHVGSVSRAGDGRSSGASPAGALRDEPSSDGKGAATRG